MIQFIQTVPKIKTGGDIPRKVTAHDPGPGFRAIMERFGKLSSGHCADGLAKKPDTSSLENDDTKPGIISGTEGQTHKCQREDASAPTDNVIQTGGDKPQMGTCISPALFAMIALNLHISAPEAAKAPHGNTLIETGTVQNVQGPGPAAPFSVRPDTSQNAAVQILSGEASSDSIGYVEQNIAGQTLILLSDGMRNVPQESITEGNKTTAAAGSEKAGNGGIQTADGKASVSEGTGISPISRTAENQTGQARLLSETAVGEPQNTQDATQTEKGKKDLPAYTESYDKTFKLAVTGGTRPAVTEAKQSTEDGKTLQGEAPKVEASKGEAPGKEVVSESARIEKNNLSVKPAKPSAMTDQGHSTVIAAAAMSQVRTENKSANSDLPKSVICAQKPAFSQVAEKVTQAAKTGDYEFDMKLFPEGLGKVEVKMVCEGETLSLTVTAHTSEAQKLLSSQIPELKTALAANYQVSQLHIRLENKDAAGNPAFLYQGFGSPGQGGGAFGQAASRYGRMEPDTDDLISDAPIFLPGTLNAKV